MLQLDIKFEKLDIDARGFKVAFRHNMRSLAEGAAIAFLNVINQPKPHGVPVWYGTSRGGYEALAKLVKPKYVIDYTPWTKPKSYGKRAQPGIDTFEQGGTSYDRARETGSGLSTAKFHTKGMEFGFEFNHGVAYYYEQETSQTNWNVSKATPWDVLPKARDAAVEFLHQNMHIIPPMIGQYMVKTEYHLVGTSARMFADRTGGMQTQSTFTVDTI